MKIDSNTTMTDSLERILIEREANAMHSVVDATTWRDLLAGSVAVWRLATDTLRKVRGRARDAHVDYVAG